MTTTPLPRTLRGAAMLAALVIAPLLPAQAAGRVEVRYVDADKFADIGFGTLERERTLKSLTEVLQRLGQQLPDGQTLQLDVTNVDLAGMVEWWRPSPIRVMRGRADWPRIELRWTLQSGGSTLKSGQEAVSDMAYMMGSRLSDARDGELSYERRMLKKWFDTTFGSASTNP